MPTKKLLLIFFTLIAFNSFSNPRDLYKAIVETSCYFMYATVGANTYSPNTPNNKVSKKPKRSLIGDLFNTLVEANKAFMYETTVE